MRLLRTSLLARSSLAAAAGTALIIPLTSVANADDQASPAVAPLPALEHSEYVTLDQPFQAPALSTSTTGAVDPNYLLTTPGGFTGASAVIYDNNGQVIWSRNGNHINFEQVTYLGQPALATFDSAVQAHVILDQSYQQIDTIAVANGAAPTDGHDIEFNADGTRVLVEGWATMTVDLSQWGGAANASIAVPVIQEQDVATGQVTFEWNALDHVSPDETTEPMTGSFGFIDLFHINSISYDSDGNILANFRNTSTVYKIDINSGDIIWRFGGENNDFTFTGGATEMPSYQHDAQRLPDGTLSVFDNGNGRNPQESWGAIYDIDEASMTATRVQQLRANPAAFSMFIGNNRQVPNGNQLVDYGTTGRMVEFANGQEVFTGTFAQGATSYRADRTDNWTGTPAQAPAVVVSDAAEDGTRTLNVSWNGATEVDSWRILAGPSETELTELGTTPKTGFETAAEITAPENADVFKVVALDATGKALDSRTLSTTP